MFLMIYLLSEVVNSMPCHKLSFVWKIKLEAGVIMSLVLQLIRIRTQTRQ